MVERTEAAAGAGARPGAVERVARRLPQYARAVSADPAWTAMFVLARFAAVRRLLSAVGARGAPAAAVSEAVEGDPAAAVADLRRDGLARGLRLRPEVLGAIRTLTETRPCYADADPARPVLVPWTRRDGPPPEAADAVVADYRDGIHACPEIRGLRDDPVLLSIAAAYLGRRPVPKRSRLWWTFRGVAADPARRSVFSVDSYHFDLDDWLCVKFFFHAVDVGPDDGPHAAVLGSHARRSLAAQLSPFKGRSAASLAAEYPPEAFALLSGEAGTGFAEDPFCYHTGTTPAARSRLMLEVEFGVSACPVAGPYGSALG
jgi:hypothetical protein